MVPHSPALCPRMLQETRKRLLAKAKALVDGMPEETRLAHLARAKKMVKQAGSWLIDLAQGPLDSRVVARVCAASEAQGLNPLAPIS